MNVTRAIKVLALALAALGPASLVAAAEEAAPSQTQSQAQAQSQGSQRDLTALLEAMSRLPAGARSQVYPTDFPWSDAQKLMTGDPAADAVLATLFGPGAEGEGLPGALEVLHRGLPGADVGLVPPGLEPDAFRARLLEMTKTLRRFGSDLPPGLAASLDRFDRGIAALSREQLAAVMLGLAPERPRLAGAKDGIRATVAASMDDCTGSFPEKEICQIDALFDEVSSFFDTTLPHFFTVEAPEAILGALQALLDLALELIPSPDELVGLLGLDNPDWEAIAGSLPSGVFFGPPPAASASSSTAAGGVAATTEAEAGVQLPCPAQGTNIFPFGEMGDIEAFYSCKRTAEWLLRVLFKTSPKDGEGLKVKIAVGVVYFPTKYLCGCFEKSWFVPFWNDQLAHTADMTTRMDVNLSTRALQTELDGAMAQEVALDEAADTALELSEDLDARLAALNVAGGEGSELQEALMELRLTHLLEVDLSRRANGPAVGLFQLPAAHGGLLEKAAAIADGAIDDARARGGNVKKAEGDFATGAALQQAGHFKGAYEMYRVAYQEALAALR